MELDDAVLKHLGDHIGEVAALSSMSDEEGKELPFRVAEIPDAPSEGAATYATVGLGATVFPQPDGSSVRHELLLAGYRRFPADEMEGLIAHAGYEVLRSQECIVLGQIVDFGRPLFAATRMEGLFFSTPVYFDDALSKLDAISPPIVFAWLIAIHREEIDLVRTQGPDALTDLFAAKDPDLLDFARPTVA